MIRVVSFRVLAVLVMVLAQCGCGEYFRPVAIPITPTQANPASSHYMLSLSDNGPNNPGGSTRINVSGDTNSSIVRVGLGPVHAALLPSGGNVYIANQLEDTVSRYNPSQTSPASTVSLPAGSAPVFVGTTQNSTVYVANSGTATVAVIQALNNIVTNLIPVGPDPVALAETPDGAKVYVASMGNTTTPGSVTSINTVDNSVNQNAPLVGFPWSSPVWVAARSDSTRVYVLDSGSGLVSDISTSVSGSTPADTVLGSVPVGAGANFMLYDANRSRLYVTNPALSTLTVLNASSDPPAVLSTISFAASGAANAPCPSGCAPVSVAALPDGSRVYVASYEVTSACSDPMDTPPCLVSQVTVINATNNSVSKTIPLNLVKRTSPPTVPPQLKPDTTELPVCSSARFRLSAAASADSSRVYVAYCDAEAVAVIRTTPNTSPGSENSGDYLVTDLDAPVSAQPPGPDGQPPPQNPVFVLAGP
jgi:DNA-binding beta-propeller fold protein YncE